MAPLGFVGLLRMCVLGNSRGVAVGEDLIDGYSPTRLPSSSDGEEGAMLDQMHGECVALEAGKTWDEV